MWAYIVYMPTCKSSVASLCFSKKSWFLLRFITFITSASKPKGSHSNKNGEKQRIARLHMWKTNPIEEMDECL